MVSLQLDSNNNLVFTNNLLTVIDEKSVIQDIKNLLLMFITENPFDTVIGLDYYSLASQNNKTRIQNAIIERTMEDDRIQSVKNISVDFSNMGMDIKLSVQLKNGVIVNV